MQGGFITVYAVLFVMFYSQWRASNIRGGHYRKVTVEFKTDSQLADGAFRVEGRALLGPTARFVLLFDSVARRTDVVPLDSIARLVWDARSCRERAADDVRATPVDPAAEPPTKPSAPAVLPTPTPPSKPGNP